MALDHSGCFSATLADSGIFSAKLLLPGNTYATA
jgi:hypothetical protein